MQQARAALYARLEMVGNLVHDSVPVSDNEVQGSGFGLVQDSIVWFLTV